MISTLATQDRSTLAAEDARQPKEEIVQSMIRYFQPIEALEFEVLKNVEVVSQPSENYSHQLQYAAREHRYKYTFIQESHDTGSDDLETISFDGVRGYYFRKSNGELDITPSRNSDRHLSQMQGFFEPFAFILAKENDGTPHGALMFPTLKDYKEAASWKVFAGQLDNAVAVKRNGEETLCVTMPGEIMPWTRAGTTFKVFLSRKLGYYPVAWERTAADGSFRYVYEVNDLQKFPLPDGQGTVLYPSAATLEKFTPADNSTPKIKAVILLNALRINQMQEENWAIDLAQAKFSIDTTVSPSVIKRTPK